MSDVSRLDKLITVGTILIALIVVGKSAATVIQVHSESCESIIRDLNSSIGSNDSLEFYSEEEYSNYLDTGFRNFTGQGGESSWKSGSGLIE